MSRYDTINYLIIAKYIHKKCVITAEDRMSFYTIYDDVNKEYKFNIY